MSTLNIARRAGRIRAGEIARAAALLLLVAIAPYPDPYGGCGQAAEELDAAAFFAAKADIDCARCVECGVDTRACVAACGAEPASAFPHGCRPLVHDGEVCLRRLRITDCDDYRAYLADDGALTPTECNFCPVEEAP
jgi:hypothetical protein